jgi:hypothetical protein
MIPESPGFSRGSMSKIKSDKEDWNLLMKDEKEKDKNEEE